MWRRAAAKLISLRSSFGSVASSPWLARLPSSGNLSMIREYVFLEPAAMKSVARPKPVIATPIWSSVVTLSTGPAAKEREEMTGYDVNELVGGDIVDYDFINGPFGTEEKPAVMRSFFYAQVAGCCGPDKNEHDKLYFWLRTGVISVCPICLQHFTLECVGRGGFPGPFD